MKLLKKAYGNILLGLSLLLSFTLDLLIRITSLIVDLVKGLGRWILSLLAAGGCLILFFLAGPLGIYLLLNPLALITIILLIAIPILGNKLVSYLKYIKYISREYLQDRSEYYILGVDGKYQSFDEYKSRYWRMEEEKWRREQARRQAEQQRIWEERFREWYEYQQTYSQNSNYGQQGYANPSIEFKRQFEESCKLLGVAYDADKYEIKLAYRQKAKEYHPDINPSPDATAIFQQINRAYEFLSDGNIERYKELNRG